MTINNIEKFFKKYHKGTFTKAMWKSEKIINGETFTKETTGVVRFVKYANIQGVEVKGKANPNEITLDQWCFLIQNQKTGNINIQVATTNHKTHSKYYRNGKEIDKQEYETFVKPQTNKAPLVVFRININNLISLG